MIRNEPKRIQFRGGINKAVERAVLNGFSEKNNLRDLHPGFISRKGQIRMHPTTDASQEILTLFQHKDKAKVLNLYAQRADGSVHKSAFTPPNTGVGNFGSEILPSRSGVIPATWAILDDYVLFADGKRGRVYSGNNQMIKAFIVYKGASAIPVIPEQGEDYTNEVTDDDTTRVAVLSNLQPLSSYDAIYIGTEVPANRLNFTVQNPNTNASSITVQYWKSNGTWGNVSGLADGTYANGRAFSQSGSITWTHPSDEISHYQFGVSGYFYRIIVSHTLSSSVTVSQVTYSGDWKPFVNVWDGVLVKAIEALVHRASTTNHSTYSADNVNVSSLFGDSGDYVYFSSLHPLSGFHVSCGATTNIRRAVVTGTFTFVDGGAGDDYITWDKANFDVLGFEVGQTITISGSTYNNKTLVIKNVSSSRLTVPTGTLANETKSGVTISYNAPSCTMSVQYWNGSSWVNVSNLNDGTKNLTQDGFVTFARTLNAQKRQYEGSVYYAYWYRFRLTQQTSRNVSIAISTMPFFDINEWGKPFCTTSWKGRPVLSFDKYGQYIHIGALGRVSCFNGDDYAPFEVGDDGRSNKVLAMVQFYQDLMVFQEETGAVGGSITLIQGYDPKSYGRMILSNKIGIMNGKSYAVVDGVATPENPKASHVKYVYFLSRYGVFATDGVNVINISENIPQYFDPTNAQYCVRKGYESKHWLRYDSAYHCLRIGLCTGSNATEVNTFLVYDIKDKSWGTDTLGQPLSCMTEVEAGSGDLTVLQIGGGVDGFVYRLNYGLNDVGAVSVPVHAHFTLEIDGNGNKLDVKTLQVRCKAQDTGTIAQSIAYNGSVFFVDNNVIDMRPVNNGDTYRYNDFTINRRLEDHLSLRLSHNSADEEVVFLDATLLDVEVKNVYQKK